MPPPPPTLWAKTPKAPAPNVTMYPEFWTVTPLPLPLLPPLPPTTIWRSVSDNPLARAYRSAVTAVAAAAADALRHDAMRSNAEGDDVAVVVNGHRAAVAGAGAIATHRHVQIERVAVAGQIGLRRCAAAPPPPPPMLWARMPSALLP